MRRRVLSAAAAALMAVTGMVVLAASPAAAPPPQVLKISEFRFQGLAPGMGANEFVEVANIGTETHLVSSFSGSGYAIVAGDGQTRCVIPDGTEIPPGGHFLCVNSLGYSLAGYPAGNGTTATPDATFTADIPGNSGVALFDTSLTTDQTLDHRMDAAGFTTADALYREGAGIPTIVPTFWIDHSFQRNLTTPSIEEAAITNPTPGIPQDTDDNLADFVFVDTNGTSAGAGQRLGAPSPENLSSPVSFAGLSVGLLDPCVPADAPPNTVRDTTPDPANNSQRGTLSFRRRITNTTELSVSRLRLRIADIRTFPAPSGIADLRPRTSTPLVVTVDREPCGSGTSNVTVGGTALEQPPTQLNGGGFLSSWDVGTVTLATPLGPGESVDVQMLSGIQQMGGVAVRIVAEALADGTPGGPAEPVCLGSAQGGGDDGGGREIVGVDMCVPPAPVVTDDPDAETVTVGETAEFTAAATGYETVRWESSTNGTDWTTVPDATTTTLSFVPTIAQSGTQYRAVFVDEDDDETPTEPATLTVDQVTTTVEVTASPASPESDDDVTLTAAVSPSTATGTVTFAVDGNQVGQPVAVSGGSASTSPLDLSTGDHTFTATYSGDTNHAGSTDGGSVTVSPQGTTTEVEVEEPPTPVWGDDVTFTATVSPSTATGTVTFAVDGNQVGSPVAVANGSATSSAVGDLAVGPHTVTATYSGDADHSGSTDSASFSVAQQETTVEASADPELSQWGQTVTLGATVDPVPTGGTVQFSVGGDPVGDPVAVDTTTGKASITAPTLPVGPHTVTATYSGDTNHSGSTDTAPFEVRKRITATEITEVWPAMPVEGQDLEVTFTVSPADATGQVVLAVDDVEVGDPVGFSGGQATLTLPDLEPGTYEVEARYSGSAVDSLSGDSTTVTVMTEEQWFVRRAYQSILGRDAEPAGLAYWVGRLEAGGSRLQVTESLARSAEGRRRVVTIVYGWILNRAVDQGGMDYWTGRLADGLTVEALVAHVVTGPESQAMMGDTAEGLADRFYMIYLGRAGDPAGVDYWAGRIEAATTAAALRSVATSFGRSAEVTAVAVNRAVTAVCPKGTDAPSDGSAGAFYASSGRDPLRLVGWVLANVCPSPVEPG